MADILRDELLNDPLIRGYSTMSDREAADDLKTEYRTRNRAFMTGDEVYRETDNTEFEALTNHKQNLWMAFCGRSDISTSAPANKNFVKTIYGASGVTTGNLNTARVETISRAVELGIRVGEGLVEVARA